MAVKTKEAIFGKQQIELRGRSPGKKLLRTDKYETIATMKRIVKSVMRDHGNDR